MKNNFQLFPGTLSDNSQFDKDFDVVTILAVFEHLSSEQKKTIVYDIHSVLTQDGLVLLTVPSPFVDIILFVLLKLRLIDGMDVDQHHGFKPKDVLSY